MPGAGAERGMAGGGGQRMLTEYQPAERGGLPCGDETFVSGFDYPSGESQRL